MGKYYVGLDKDGQRQWQKVYGDKLTAEKRYAEQLDKMQAITASDGPIVPVDPPQEIVKCQQYKAKRRHLVMGSEGKWALCRGLNPFLA